MEQVTYNLKELCRAANVTERTVRYYIKEGLLPPPEGAGPFSRYGYEHRLRLLLIRRLKEEFLPLIEIKHRLAARPLAELDILARRAGLLAAGEVPPSPGDGSAGDRLSRLVLDQGHPGPASLRQQLAAEAGGPESSTGAAEDYFGFDTRARHSTGAGRPPAPAPASPGPPPAEMPSRPMMSAGPPPVPRPAASQSSPPPGQFGAASFHQRLGRAEERPLRPNVRPPSFEIGAGETGAEPAPPGPLVQSWERIIIAPGVELHVESELARQKQSDLQGLVQQARRLLGH